MHFKYDRKRKEIVPYSSAWDNLFCLQPNSLSRLKIDFDINEYVSTLLYSDKTIVL